MKIKTDHAITRARLFFANTVTDIAITQITIIASLTGEKLRRIFARRFLDLDVRRFGVVHYYSHAFSVTEILSRTTDLKDESTPCRWTM
jgi:hypothetical protein